MASVTLLKGDSNKMKSAELQSKIKTFCVVFEEEIKEEQDSNIIILPDEEHSTVSLKHSKRLTSELFCFDGVFKLPENDLEIDISSNQADNSFKQFLSGIITGCLNGQQRIIHVISSVNSSKLAISRIIFRLMEEVFQRKKKTTIVTLSRKEINDVKENYENGQQKSQDLNEGKTNPLDNGLPVKDGMILQTMEEATELLDTMVEVDMGRSSQILQETQILFSSSCSKKKGMLVYLESQVKGEGDIAEQEKNNVMQNLRNIKQESKCNSTTIVFACDAARSQKDADLTLDFFRFSREIQGNIEDKSEGLLQKVLMKNQDEVDEKTVKDLIAQNKFISQQTIQVCRDKLTHQEFIQLFTEINLTENKVFITSPSNYPTSQQDTQQNNAVTTNNNDQFASQSIDFRVNFLQAELNKITAKYQSLAESVLKQESTVEIQKKDQQISSLKEQLAKAEQKSLIFKEKLKKCKEQQADSNKTYTILQALYDDQEKHLEEVDDDVQTQRSQMNMLYQQSFEDEDDEEAEIWRKRNQKYEYNPRKISGEQQQQQLFEDSQTFQVFGQKKRNEQSPEIRQGNNQGYFQSAIDGKQQMIGINSASSQQFNQPYLGSVNQTMYTNHNQLQSSNKVQRIASQIDLQKQSSFEMKSLQLNNSQEQQQQQQYYSQPNVYPRKYNPLRQSLQHQPSSYNSSRQTPLSLENNLHQQQNTLRIEVNQKYPQDNTKSSILSKIFSTTNSLDSPKRSKQPSPVNHINSTLPSLRNKALSNSYFKESAAIMQLNTTESAETNTGSTMATMPNSQNSIRSALTRTDFVRSAIPTLSPFVNSFSYKLPSNQQQN